MTEPSDREVAVFSAARQLPAGERAAYLDEACGGDAALRRRVEELLQAGEEAGAFLEEPASGAQRPADLSASVHAAENAAAPGEKIGDHIGRYKLLQQIGEGGCGAVYMAEQEEPVRRRVALKVIKLGMDTKSVIARFEAERQALALMDHPNIAKVLDAGATETGRPYFVMELVRGVKITDYCDQNNLTTRERLDLFIQVCQAVQHAHQKGVIHRDLKPSNILVTMRDGVPVPKVIDFGIAKATTGQPLTDKTLFTAFEQFLGTPAYMSPEQAEMSELGIDTRSDIYSLGVLLYELLTGMTPFDQKDLLAAGLDEMRRTIREKEPPKPSTRLTQELAAAEKVGRVAPRAPSGERVLESGAHGVTRPNSQPSALNSQQVKELIPLLRGDLDWIVMKCLEKNRARRYETANAVAMDIQRHLNDEPVVVRPPSRFYEFQKTVRRHKFGFAAAAALVTVLAVGVAVSASQAFRARRAERQEIRLREDADKARAHEAALRLKAEAHEQAARTEAAKAQAVTKFLQEALSTVNPRSGRGKSVLVRDVLDETARKLDQGAFKEQPDVEALLRRTVGVTYARLGLGAAGRPHLEKALAFARRHFSAQDAQLAEWLCDIAPSRGAEAKPLLEEALAIQRAALGPDAPEIARTLQMLAQLEGNHLNKQALYRQAIKIYEKAGLQESDGGVHALHYLAIAMREAGDPAGAIPLLREALDKSRRFGRDKSDLGDTLLDLAYTLNLVGQREEVESLYRESLASLRESVEFAHPNMEDSLFRLSEFLKARGQPEKAEAVLLEQYALLKGDARCTSQVEERLLQMIVALYRAWHSEKLADWQPKLAAVGPKVFEEEITQDTEAIQREPPDVDALRRRGLLLASHCRWKEAAADIARLIKLDPADHNLYHELAPLLVQSGDLPAYRRHCAQELARFTGTSDPNTADRMAKNCLILPDSGVDLSAVSAWADTAVTAGKDSGAFPWFQFCKGLAEYRQGHLAGAVDWTQKALSRLGDIPERDVEAYMVLAMAQYRSKQAGEAGATLAKGVEIAERKLPKLDSGCLGGGWIDWIIAHALLKEAKALIEGQPAKPKE